MLPLPTLAPAPHPLPQARELPRQRLHAPPAVQVRRLRRECASGCGCFRVGGGERHRGRRPFRARCLRGHSHTRVGSRAESATRFCDRASPPAASAARTVLAFPVYFAASGEAEGAAPDAVVEALFPETMCCVADLAASIAAGLEEPTGGARQLHVALGATLCLVPPRMQRAEAERLAAVAAALSGRIGDACGAELLQVRARPSITAATLPRCATPLASDALRVVYAGMHRGARRCGCLATSLPTASLCSPLAARHRPPPRRRASAWSRAGCPRARARPRPGLCARRAASACCSSERASRAPRGSAALACGYAVRRCTPKVRRVACYSAPAERHRATNTTGRNKPPSDPQMRRSRPPPHLSALASSPPSRLRSPARRPRPPRSWWWSRRSCS